MALSSTCEVFDMSTLRAVLDTDFAGISGQCCTECLRCGKVLEAWSVVTADVDQAFEACAAGLVQAAWRFFAGRYSEHYGDHIMVKRGRKASVKVGQRGFGGNAFCFAMGFLERAVVAYTFITLVAYGDCVSLAWFGNRRGPWHCVCCFGTRSQRGLVA